MTKYKKVSRDITNLTPVNDKLNSEYGNIRYEDWCKKEIKRIGNPKFYLRYTSGCCCIAK